MRLGICTTDFQRTEARALFARIASLGFSVAQFNFSSIAELDFHDTPELEIPSSVPGDVIERIRLAAARSDVEIVAVNGTFNAAHPDASVREEGIRRFEGFAAAVSRLRCPVVTLCTGTRNRESLWKYSPENNTQEAWDDMLKTVRALVQIAERYALTLAIETEASNVVNTAEKAARLIDEIGSKRLRIVMDCANLFLPGMAKPENVCPVIADAFDRLGGKIVLSHGKDILEGAGIEFCATGDGIVNFPYFFERLAASGYRGDMLLHGIFSEEAMVRAVKMMRPFINHYPL